ncbi:hypothetical protein BU23DRAFT_280995 [Bimuria novae-zelandiae CBS 107.79]|uniref:Uncharacterized protein n=1 Tax=Bimuria novae-zelandiae CBS 107.79 TaxID=1447943 RepID=A0A6A5UYP5_9PLEO|nr:hypothetical protein BU23DRAFT_280995 [Bimuria novae-zelandiae CBS 107.79]
MARARAHFAMRGYAVIRDSHTFRPAVERRRHKFRHPTAGCTFPTSRPPVAVLAGGGLRAYLPPPAWKSAHSRTKPLLGWCASAACAICTKWADSRRYVTTGEARWFLGRERIADVAALELGTARGSFEGRSGTPQVRHFRSRQCKRVMRDLGKTGLSVAPVDAGLPRAGPWAVLYLDIIVANSDTKTNIECILEWTRGQVSLT